MKKRQALIGSTFLTLCIFLMTNITLYGQWSISGNNVYRLTGNVGIGTSTPDQNLVLARAGATSYASFVMETYSTNWGYYPFMSFRKSNSNTLGTKNQTNPGNYLGALVGYGVGTNGGWAPGAQLSFVQAGTAGAANVPGEVRLATSDGSSWPVDRLIINSEGNIGMGITTPTEILDVNGNVNIAAGSAYKIGGENVLRIQSGNYNSFVGSGSGYFNTAGGDNSFVGHASGYYNTTGNYNSFIGAWSGFYNTTGSNNSFVGNRSGLSNTTGGDNSFIGYASGYNNTTGSDNVFIGWQSGYENVTGNANSFVGSASGMSNTTGNYNSFVGYGSGHYNTTGSNNSFLGYASGMSNTAGNYNSFLGCQSGMSNTTGNSNLFLGCYSGEANTTGQYNSFLGRGSGKASKTGSKNLFIGCQSGYSITSGSGNIFLGYQAGYNETGSNKLYISNSDTSDPLIYGEFDNNTVTINGTLTATAFVGDGSGLTGISGGSGAAVPTGVIVMWSGAIANIPDDWALCNGSNGTPDLRDRFIVGAGNTYNPGNTGGEVTHTLTVTEMPNHKHDIPRGVETTSGYGTNTYSVTGHHETNNSWEGTRYAGSGQAHENRPPYYALAYIMKLEESSQNEKIEKEIEEKSKIEKLEKEMAELKQLVSLTPQNNAIPSENRAKLYQNTPNPFNQQTEIQYFLSDEVGNAAILVFDMNGKQLKSYGITQKGKGKIVIYGNDFRAGMYLYSLVADSKIIDTKRMILTE